MVEGMKYDINFTINAFRHIFTFKATINLCSPYTNIFLFSVGFYCPYRAINKSIFVYLTPLCEMFFSPWKWHLKSRNNIYAIENVLYVEVCVQETLFLFR